MAEMDMTQHNTPIHIDPLGDLTLKLEGHTAELGTMKHGPAMVLPPHMCRCLAKELQMVAAETERKAARDMCDNAAEVMTR